MKTDARIYAEFAPVAVDAWARLRESMPLFIEARLENDTIVVEHEGYGLDPDDVEAFVRDVAALGASGHLDHIDDEAWILRRYVVDKGVVRMRKVGLNEVLDSVRTS